MYQSDTVDFKEATDVMIGTPPMTLGRIAEVFGKEMHTIARARMEGANSRRPPAGWQPVLARLAHEHAQVLREYAGTLDRLAEDLGD